MSVYDEKPWLNSYDSDVPNDCPIIEGTYTSFMLRGLAFNPEHPAAYFLGTEFKYKELDEASSKFASFLSAQQCQKGDVIGICLPNTPQYLIAIAGILKAGCVISGVSPLLTPKELVHQLNDSQVKVLITLDILLEEKKSAFDREIPNLQTIVLTNIADYLSPSKRLLGRLLGKIPKPKAVSIPGKTLTTLKAILGTYSAAYKRIAVEMDDTALLQYTGGTTGPSKGAELTHRNIMSDIAQTVFWIESVPDGPIDSDYFDQFRGTEIVSAAFPLFHLGGLSICLFHLGGGNTQLLVPDPRNTDLICKDLIKYKPTVMSHVPTLYQMMMENPLFKKIDFSNMTLAMSGAAPFDVESFKKLESFVGKGKICEVYGMTETSPLITINPLDGKKKYGSVGLPALGTRIKIVDVHDGTTEMPVNEPGELIVNGPQVMKGYYAKPEATAKTIKTFQGEQWLYTGDVARMDEDGYIYIVDRTKDMALVGGYNVYTKQVEDTLYELSEIELCGVVGIPNPERPGSDIIKAVVQLTARASKADREALKKKFAAYCKENLAPYKVPKIYEFTDEIPLTAVGKVDKKMLRV